MAIQENALNAVLAEVLSNLPDENLRAVPERTQKKTGARRCDVQIFRGAEQFYNAALECKIGQELPQQRAAIKDAQRWLKEPACWNALALCYPESLSRDSEQSLSARMLAANDLLMVRVNKQGAAGRWRRGSVRDLARLADDVGLQTYAIVKILREAILIASENIGPIIGKKLAEALELPWKKEGDQNNPRPARVACLLLANMALLQNRLLDREEPIPGLESLLTVRQAPNKQVALYNNWKRIAAVDYHPVVDPALMTLKTLAESSVTEILIECLLDAVLDCIPYIHGLRLDHSGSLYHELLQTARYDGSFYTSTPAAVLLAELAMPRDWNALSGGWDDVECLRKLRICDPACGTGTLLMAAAHTIEERFRRAGGSEDDVEVLHLSLIEDGLIGLDINQHAIHLTASMLTLIAPSMDYNRMNLHIMRHGVNEKGQARAGSLDLLADTAETVYIPGISPDARQRRLAPQGYKGHTPVLAKQCDLVIMNPPYTRNSIHNLQLPQGLRDQVKHHKIDLAQSLPDTAHRKAIDQTTVGTFFTPIADRLLNRTGSFACVKPFTFCTNVSGKHERALLIDPQRFHLELVVTSHDNRRIQFSENTNIHESLIVARRPSKVTEGKATAFVSLSENPTYSSDGYFLAQAIRKAMEGDRTELADYGTIAWRTLDQLRGRPWNAAAFYDQSLAEDYDAFLLNPHLKLLRDAADVEPDGRLIRGTYAKARQQQSPDHRALWHHQTERQAQMLTGPDEFLVPKKGKIDYSSHLWLKRSHLLLANRMRLNVVRTPAVFSEEPILGSAFVPVTPKNGEDASTKLTLCKAWCVWLNSTVGVLAFLNIRQKQLTYPNFSLDGLRSLPVPSSRHCDIDALAQAFDEYAEKKLLPLPQLPQDTTRHALDDAVLAAVPGLDRQCVISWRKAIAREPSVNNERDQFELS